MPDDSARWDEADFPPMDWRLDEDEPCPYCGEPACERSCTGAILEDDAGEGEA